MKKIYSTPVSTSIDIITEKLIAASVGVSSHEVDAANSLSNKKEDMWGKQNIWE